MFIVKVVDKETKKDIVINREYEKQEEATKYYNLIKSNALIDKEKVIRPANEELGQKELKYVDVILYLLNDEKVISKFMIG